MFQPSSSERGLNNKRKKSLLLVNFFHQSRLTTVLSFFRALTASTETFVDEWNYRNCLFMFINRLRSGADNPRASLQRPLIEFPLQILRNRFYVEARKKKNKEAINMTRNEREKTRKDLAMLLRCGCCCRHQLSRRAAVFPCSIEFTAESVWTTKHRN